MQNEPIYLPPPGSRGLPLQAGEVAELGRQTTPLTTACRIALEFLGVVFAFGALAFGLIAFFALR